MRVIIARMTSKQVEKLEKAEWWGRIQEAFREYPAQLQVIRTIFKYGLRVGENGKIMCGNIKVPSIQVAKEAGVDRRTVETTARSILSDERLKAIFSNLEPVPYLKNVAQYLGLGVIEITAKDATKPGIIHEVSGVLSKFKISVRQAVTDDPYLVALPKLTIVTDRPVKGRVIEALRNLHSVQSVVVY